MSEPTPVWTLPAELATDDPTSAAALLSTYFHSRGSDGEPAYTGAMFETFAGGGDQPTTADRFSADDIVAVSTLNVNVPAAATLRILGAQSQTLSELLSVIPADLDLHDADAMPHISTGAPADKLWHGLRGAGCGPVTTGKLLARKRPRLLPVIDGVVIETLKHPRGQSFWLTLHHELRAHDARLVTLLEAARNKAEVGDRVSIIRCFDVVAWLAGKRTWTPKTRGRFG